VLDAPDLPAALAECLEVLAAVAGVPAGVAWLPDAARGWSAQAWWGQDPAEHAVGPAVTEAAATGTPVLVGALPPLQALAYGLVVPMMEGATCLAVVQLGGARPLDTALASTADLAKRLARLVHRRMHMESLFLQQATLDAISDGVAVVRVADGVVQYVNRAFAELTGHGGADAAGRRIDDLIGSGADDVVRAIAEGRHPSGQWHRVTVTHACGDKLEVEWTSSAIHGAGGRAFAVVALRDSSDLVQAAAAERNLRMVIGRANLDWRATFDAIDFPILVLEPEGKVVRLNHAASMLAGKSYEECVGKNVDELGPGLEPWKSIRSVVTAGQPQSQVMQVVDDVEGTTWDVEIRAFEVQADEKVAPRLTIVARDVTLQKRLQESLSRNERMSAMGALLSSVAHEVRNPLFGLSATLDAFEARFGDQREHTIHITIMRQELKRLVDLMTDLLEYGKPPLLHRTVMDFEELLRRAVRRCLVLRDQHAVTVEVEVAGGIGTLSLDSSRMEEVFRNLIENAIQHSERGSTVHVAARAERRGRRQMAVCEVRDRGPGIDHRDLQNIFEPFFTRRKGGTGLGLSIVQRIVDQHGGRVVAANHPEGGAMLTVYLPLEVTATGDEQAAS
jgi:PAS domain S-box-containing protein